MSPTWNDICRKSGSKKKKVASRSRKATQFRSSVFRFSFVLFVESIRDYLPVWENSFSLCSCLFEETRFVRRLKKKNEGWTTKLGRVETDDSIRLLPLCPPFWEKVQKLSWIFNFLLAQSPSHPSTLPPPTSINLFPPTHRFPLLSSKWPP